MSTFIERLIMFSIAFTIVPCEGTFSDWLVAVSVTCAKWYAMLYHGILYVLVVRDHVENSLNYERVVSIKL